MNKKEYITLIDELKTLPVPGTILYPPSNKGHKLLGYRVGESYIEAIIELPTNPCVELEWSLEQIKQCNWENMK